jgi:hypothetical protein
VLSPHKKWLPSWLYQALPYVYSLVGVLAIGYFDSFTGYNAGILLLFAAFLIWMMRNNNKS